MMQRKFPIYYETHGIHTDPCIILITGLGGQLIQWSKQFIEGLVSQNLYVVTFDNRDSGSSQYYDHLGAPNFEEAMQAKQSGKEFKPPYTFNDIADDIFMLMNQLSIQKAHILGSSMGGMIAQVFAMKYPKHLLSLILIATSSGDANLPPPKPEVLQIISSSFSTNTENIKSYVENKIKLFRLYDPYFFNEESARSLFEQMYKRTLSPDGFMRQSLSFLCEKPRGENLKNVNVKTLIVHGSDDAAFPMEHGKYLSEVLPNSRLEIIEKMGHVIPDELCNKILYIITDFIKYNLTEKPLMRFSIQSKL
jgi:pimeloyl-ACP methyl ester carboxylesterase